VTHSIEADVLGLCAALAKVAGSDVRADSSWTESWRGASERVDGYLDRSFAGVKELNEPLVARFISQHVPQDHALVVASSMPVRDLDAYAATDGAYVPVVANRGASGIDGTVATAVGFARGSGRPLTLLIGDLALLHDLNSLAMLRDLPVVVVVLNNDGGAIFSFLPIASHRAFFEPYFGTPHGANFEAAAVVFGLKYDHPRSVTEFVEAYRAACVRGGQTLIEIRTDRAENVALHRRLLGEISDVL
jgi:2-succinyl-5-enolpyruvyl-6-hydroxy-3-cyclohexene-1-carboxylate synthase